MKKYIVFILVGGLSIFLLGFGIGINSKSEKKEQAHVLSGQAKPSSTPTPTIQSHKTDQPEPTQKPITSAGSAETVTVTKVVDGDTIQISTGKTVRYIGINTPETVDPRRGVQCFGHEASDKNKELVLGKVIRLEKDISETDKYGRLLRYIYVGDQFINKILVEEGYAYSSSYPPDVKYQDIFKKAQALAQQNQKGLWKACEGSQSSSTQSVQGSSQSKTGGDKDCKDFKTQKTAQDFFIAQGGPAQDPHKLDQDHDGVVCESLP